jgi:hypothetical protein
MHSISRLILLGACPWTTSGFAVDPFGVAAPSWMSDAAKDSYDDVKDSSNAYDDKTCEAREKLLNALRTTGTPEVGKFRFVTLKDIGVCEFNKGEYKSAKKRMDSGVAELNLPNDDIMTTNPEFAHIGFFIEAAKFMSKYELTQAATSLRRSREVADRNLKSIMKVVHNNMAQKNPSMPPLEKLVEEISGLGKSGTVMPELSKNVPILKHEFAFAEQIHKAIEDVDKQLATFAPAQKAIRKTLDSKSKDGSLMYAKGLVSEAIVIADRSMTAMDMTSGGLVKAFKEEAESSDKSVTLLKKGKLGKGCEEGKGFDKTCQALVKIADLKSNGFGDTKVVVVKAGKKHDLERCTTNANIGILVAASDGVTVTVADETSTLTAGLPIVVDFCQEASLEASSQAAVLFAQAWHPEFAAVERTSELRARAKSFGLSKEEVKDITKVVNDFAKKNWEKSGKQWRNESPLQEAIWKALREKVEAKKKAEDAADVDKVKAEEEAEEQRKKDLAALEKKRADRTKKQEEAARKKEERRKQMELERANKDPWLNDPSVVEAQKKLDDLKEARRDANAKLEFELSTQLTKEISAAEQALKKITKKAKKAHKKAQKGGDDGKKDDKEDL